MRRELFQREILKQNGVLEASIKKNLNDCGIFKEVRNNIGRKWTKAIGKVRLACIKFWICRDIKNKDLRHALTEGMVEQAVHVGALYLAFDARKGSPLTQQNKE